MTIGLIFAFIAWAAVGTLVRATASDSDHGFNRHMYVTLALNVVGSFLLGLLADSPENSMLLAGVAGLGSMTTFSTFVSQVECIARQGRTIDAVLYAVGSIALGIAAAWFGWILAS